MKNILKNMNIIAKYGYIGDWLIDKYNDEELKREIHRRANADLIRLLNREKSMVDMESYLYLSMVYIAMDHYDQNFYDYLTDYYPEVYTLYSHQHINSKIREYIKLFRKVDENDDNRIIDHVLKDAFVPQHYLADFYKFLYDIFVVDYDYNFPQEREDNDLIQETEKEIVNLISQIIKPEVLTTNEELRVKVNEKYKNYVLTKGTVLALSQEESLKSLAPIIVKMLNLFHADFWEDNLTGTALNKHLLSGFEEWKSLNTTRSNKIKLNKSFTREILKPRIVAFKDDSVLIHTRRHIVNGAVDTDNFKIKFYNGNKLIKLLDHDTLLLKRTIGGIKIEPKEIYIDNFLGELKYCVFHNDEEIYSTLNNLHFDYLIFDNNLNYITNFKNYNNDALIVSTKKLNTSGFTEGKIDKYITYIGKLAENIVLQFEGENIFLGEKDAFKIIGDQSDSLDAMVNDIKTEVFVELDKLYVDITYENLDTLIISFNNTNYSLAEISSTIEVSQLRYALLNLSSLIIEKGYYKVKLVNSVINKETISFLYDPLFINKFDVNDDFSIHQSNNSSFFGSQIIHHSKEELEKNEISYQEKTEIFDGNKIYYRLRILVDNYTINDKYYYFSRNIWVPNLKTSLIVNTANIVSYEYLVDSNQPIFRSLNEPDNHVLISKNDLEYYLNESNNGLIHIKINKIDGEFIVLVVHKFNIYKKNNYLLIPEKDHVQMKVNYVGYNKMTVEFADENGTKKCVPLLNDSFVRIPLSTNIKYEMRIVEGEEYNPFLKNSRRIVHEILYHWHLDTDQLIHKSFSVKEVYLEEEGQADVLRGVVLERLYFDQDYTIRGILSYHERDSDILNEFDDINPVKVEFLGDVSIQENGDFSPILAYITDLDDDGLMLNKYDCTIDTGDNPKHGPISYFNLSIRGNING